MRGRMKYIPKELLEELSIIKASKGLRDSDAFRDLKNYSMIGREVERLMSFGIQWKKRK